MQKLHDLYEVTFNNVAKMNEGNIVFHDQNKNLNIFLGDRLTIQVDRVKCITSWDSCFNGYTPTTTYVWKIVDVEGNVFTWKTATFLDEENPPASIKGTVKEHKVFRDVEQTELTRCKVA